MESAAVAQVCHEYSVPFTVVRTISDAADESAARDFPRFLMQVGTVYSHEILKRLFDDNDLTPMRGVKLGRWVG